MIGIIGFGVVGQALYSSLKYQDRAEIYDQPLELGDLNLAVTRSDTLFCCLPTPKKADGSQDFSAYEAVFARMEKAGYSGVVVVKSTTLWSNLKPWMTRLNIVVNPEFLSQNSAVADFLSQRVIVLGGRADHRIVVERCYRSLFKLIPDVEVIHCTAEEAVQIKYVHNIYHAYKVLFWNWVQERTGNARLMSDMYKKITDRNEMDRIYADGKPGFGGNCFPKDVTAANSESASMLTEFMLAYNRQLRGE